MNIDNSLTPEQNVLAMINEVNTSHVLNLTQISLGVPHQTGSEPVGHNTTVAVTAIAGSGYAGSVDVTYQRIGLDQIAVAPSNVVPIPDSATSTLDTIDAVTAHFDLIAGEFSLNAAQSTRPSDGSLQVPATLSPTTDSYVYAGADIAITLQWNPLPSQGPLLDQTSATASAAFSLRQLRTEYTGPAMNVRRASDNATDDIRFASDGGLDAAGLTAFLAGADGFVTAWYDQSGNGLHAVQPSATSQPGITASADNGKPAVTFSYGQRLNLATSITQPYSIYGVCEVPTGQDRIIMFGGDNADCFLSSPTEILLRDVTDQGVSYEGSVPGTFCLLEGDCDASGDGTVLLNGTQIASGSLGTQSFTHIGFRGGYYQYSDGSITELMVFPSGVPRNDGTAINANVGATYGIAFSQPG